MQSAPQESDEATSLCRQRNLFAAFAVILIASVGFAVPRKVASYRELKAVNARLVELQAAIVANQEATRIVQGQILETQNEITKLTTR